MRDFSTKYLNQTCLLFFKELKTALWTVAVLLELLRWKKMLHLKKYMLECLDERNLFVCVCARARACVCVRTRACVLM